MIYSVKNNYSLHHYLDIGETLCNQINLSTSQASKIHTVWSETDYFYSRFYRDESYLFNHNNFLRFFPISRDGL
jgi:hypothetical protein